jgi:hypothetical protein
MPSSGYDICNFTDQTTVGVEVSFLAYHMDNREPDFSIGMQGVYHLGYLAADTPSTPGKRKGGVHRESEKAKGCPLCCRPLQLAKAT